ncbi:MAG: tRNA(His) guanylyltransferase Thg1 family protein [Flavobacteriales bacterium]|nr:tRNA(His) guanylyltransferase Thg1 family protein [Flavobacteriales bacterium]
MTDSLGKRMKEQYENRSRYFLPRRTYTIIRLDGKAFHSFTKGMERPYDQKLIDTMDYTSRKLCEEIQGSVFAYTQSDEISILLTDFEKAGTAAYFDGNIQKIASISASIATYYFNDFFGKVEDKKAFFDSRVFTIPDPVEVENYFIWRQQDAVRNSIIMAAQSLFSHKELKGKNSNDMQEMCFSKGLNWNDMPDGFKRGRLSVKVKYLKNEVERSKWDTVPAIWFTKERQKFIDLIPQMERLKPI